MASKERWDWIINPLVVAVALEVVVRPNAKTSPGVLHDLDNIVRDYLIPGIVPGFGTVSDQRWTIDFTELRARESSRKLGARTRRRQQHQEWRDWVRSLALARRRGRARICVALVADMDATGDLMEQVYECIDQWRETLDDNDRAPWRRLSHRW